eukprot:g5598.t1
MPEVASQKCKAAPGLPEGIQSNLAMEMFTLSKVVYTDKPLSFDQEAPYSEVYGWHLEYRMQVKSFLGFTNALNLEDHFGQNDNLMVFSKDSKCAVVFSGSDDWEDFVITDGLKSVSGYPGLWCGYARVHSGFAGELNRLIDDPRWKEKVVPLLTSDKCKGGLVAGGHSLGGAVASLFAACANWAGKINQATDSQLLNPVGSGGGGGGGGGSSGSGSGSTPLGDQAYATVDSSVKVDGHSHIRKDDHRFDIFPKREFRGFKVIGLYTWGAPGVIYSSNWHFWGLNKYYKRMLFNDGEADGCFPGLRVYNEDQDASDPVPWLANTGPFNWVHPRMRTVALGKPGTPAKVLECGRGDKKAEEAWDGVNSPEPKPLRFVGSLFSFDLHLFERYRERMAAQFCPAAAAGSGAAGAAGGAAGTAVASGAAGGAAAPAPAPAPAAASSESVSIESTHRFRSGDAPKAAATNSGWVQEAHQEAKTMDSALASSADGEGYYHHQEAADAKAAERLAAAGGSGSSGSSDAPAAAAAAAQNPLPDIMSQMEERNPDGHFGVKPAGGAGAGGSGAGGAGAAAGSSATPSPSASAAATSSSSSSSDTSTATPSSTTPRPSSIAADKEDHRFAAAGTGTLEKLDSVLDRELEMLSTQHR